MLALVDDERLAALAAGGSQHAFGELVQRHEARLLMVSRSVLRSDDDARDAVQNALLKAFRALQDGQLRGAPRPWLARIAHNEARSLARVRREFAPLDPEALGAAGDPHEVVLARERLATLVADVAALPERLRLPLLLRAEAGLSYDAIACNSGRRSAPPARRSATPARRSRPRPARARPTAPTSAGSSRVPTAGGTARAASAGICVPASPAVPGARTAGRSCCCRAAGCSGTSPSGSTRSSRRAAAVSPAPPVPARSWWRSRPVR